MRQILHIVVTVKIKESSRQARLVIEMLKTFDFVKFVNQDQEKTEAKSKNPYKQEFVAMVKKSAKEKGGTPVTAKTLWQDVGL